jgi:hypothetical protein
MKRKGKNRVILVSIMILLLGALLQSCEKPNTPDKPEELKPTLEVTTSPDGVLPYGKEFTLSWKTTNTKNLLINNKQHFPVEAGSLKLKLFKDTTFVVTALNIVLWTKEDKKVIVGDWTTSKIGLITHSPWRFTANKRYRDGILIRDYILTEDEKNEIYTFFLDGKYTVYRYGVRIGSDDWSLSSDESSLSLGRNPPWVGTIAHLSEKKMVLTKVQPYADGLPCLAEATYERK